MPRRFLHPGGAVVDARFQAGRGKQAIAVACHGDLRLDEVDVSFRASKCRNDSGLLHGLLSATPSALRPRAANASNATREQDSLAVAEHIVQGKGIVPGAAPECTRGEFRDASL